MENSARNFDNDHLYLGSGTNPISYTYWSGEISDRYRRVVSGSVVG
jgi:hypothetical protein